ncbi:MAG: neutral zinc metallopeptidase [Nostocoides sp.]
MSFNDNVQLDTSQVRSGGGGGGGAPGGMVVGGGIGGIILLVIALIFGINPGSVTGGGTAPAGTQDQAQSGSGGNLGSECKTGADANRDVNCLVVATVNSVQAFWATELPKYSKQYTPVTTVLYSGQTQSQCGTASNQVGPFYCPLDKKVYIDASFYQILHDQFGSSSGQLAEEYVIAHEYGHHIQDILGLLGEAQKNPQGADSGSVRIELMADCLAGVWANHASSDAVGKDATTGKAITFLKPLTQQDINDALSAAKSVGDDSIQKMSTGQVNPESWTHGSSAARQMWFTQGYKTGDLNKCDTLNAANPETSVN